MRLAYAPSEVGKQKFLDKILGITNNSLSKQEEIIDLDVEIQVQSNVPRSATVSSAARSATATNQLANVDATETQITEVWGDEAMSEENAEDNPYEVEYNNVMNFISEDNANREELAADDSDTCFHTSSSSFAYPSASSSSS